MSAEQNKGEGAGVFLIFMAVLFAVIAWNVAHDPMARLMLFGARVLAYPFAWLTDVREAIAWTEKAASAAYIKSVNFSAVKGIGNLVGGYWKWIVAALVGAAIWDARQSAIIRARTAHSITSFLKVHALRWPAIVPWVNRDLTENARGPMARSLSAFEYAMSRKLLAPVRVNTITKRKVYALDDERARQSLVADVGRPLPALEQLRVHEKALFAVFALRVLREKDAATALLGKINCSAAATATGRVNPAVALPEFEATVKRLADRKNRCVRIVLAAMQDHQFCTTFLIRMLIEARRKDGLLQPAEFLWLKEVDRRLWYALQRAPVGGRGSFVSFAEGAAALNMFQAETVAAAAGRKLKEIYIEGALRALREDLYATGYIDSPGTDS